MIEPIRTPESVEPAFEAMRYLADQCIGHPQLHESISAQIEHWNSLNHPEKRMAFETAYAKVAARCPWVRTKGRVRDVAQAFSL